MTAIFEDMLDDIERIAPELQAEDDTEPRFSVNPECIDPYADGFVADFTVSDFFIVFSTDPDEVTHVVSSIAETITEFVTSSRCVESISEIYVSGMSGELSPVTHERKPLLFKDDVTFTFGVRFRRQGSFRPALMFVRSLETLMTIIGKEMKKMVGDAGNHMEITVNAHIYVQRVMRAMLYDNYKYSFIRFAYDDLGKFSYRTGSGFNISSNYQNLLAICLTVTGRKVTAQNIIDFHEAFRRDLTDVYKKITRLTTAHEKT